MSAPEDSTLAAASAMMVGFDPNICTDKGFSAGRLSINRSVLLDLLTSPWALIISEQTNAQPASFASSRKGRLVIPASGARMV